MTRCNQEIYLANVQVQLGYAGSQITMNLSIHITDKRTHETVDQLVKYLDI